MDNLFYKWVTDHNYYGNKIKYYFLPFRMSQQNNYYLCWMWVEEENMQKKNYTIDWRPYSKISHKSADPPPDIKKGSQIMIREAFMTIPVIIQDL